MNNEGYQLKGPYLSEFSCDCGISDQYQCNPISDYQLFDFSLNSK